MGLFLAAFVFAALWSVRIKYDPTAANKDLKWVIGCIAWTYRSFLRDFVVEDYQYVLEHGGGFHWIFLLGLTSPLLSIWAIYRYQERQRRKSKDSAYEQDGLPESTNPLEPLVFPCRTTHTRFFPKKHSFSYSYLFVGIPVGWRGSIGLFLSADLKSLPWKDRLPKEGWLSVESADYLNRGDDVHGLQGKLDSYLRSQVSHCFDGSRDEMLIFPVRTKIQKTMPFRI